MSRDGEESLPTESGIPFRGGDFASLTDALDYAAQGCSGMSFFGPKGAILEQLSYAQLAEDARLTGARLRARGIEPGERVGLVAETDGDFVRGFLGCLYAGLAPCPMPLPAAFGSREAYGEQIRSISDVAGLSAALAPLMFRDWLTEALADRELKFLGALAELDGAPDVLTDRPSGDGLAYLQFSSGTTHSPKGIAVTHASVMANIRAMTKHGFDLNGQDRGVSWLPLYHDMGLVGCMLLPIGTQMSIDYIATRDFIRRPGLWPLMMSRAEATMSYAPSFGYELVARRAAKSDGLQLENWRVAGLGGDMIRREGLDAFAKAFKPAGFQSGSFMASYGLAEATLALSMPRPGEGVRTERIDLGLPENVAMAGVGDGAEAGREFVTCGRPLPGHDIEIRSADGTLLRDGAVGHIHARGPSLMQGYFNDPAQTSLALSPDGWLSTGDLGFLRSGELTITGRAKDLIILNGRNIWPQDIEWTVGRNVSYVRDGSVAAFVVDREDATACEGFKPGEDTVVVVVECREREPDQRAALGDEVVALISDTHGIKTKAVLARPGSLPRTSSGKLSRAKARAMFLAGTFSPDSPQA